jgi:hypothetical protein
MGQKAVATPEDGSHPSVADIVEEVRQAKERKLAALVKLHDLADALGVDKSNARKACKRMGIDYAYKDLSGAGYITREDAIKIAERLA